MKCYLCGSRDEVEIDHVHPIYLDGHDRLANIGLVCKPCNQDKGIKTLDLDEKQTARLLEQRRIVGTQYAERQPMFPKALIQSVMERLWEERWFDVEGFEPGSLQPAEVASAVVDVLALALDNGFKHDAPPLRRNDFAPTAIAVGQSMLAGFSRNGWIAQTLTLPESAELLESAVASRPPREVR